MRLNEYYEFICRIKFTSTCVMCVCVCVYVCVYMIMYTCMCVYYTCMSYLVHSFDNSFLV